MLEKNHQLVDAKYNLKYAFWELYKSKPIEKISIKEITSKAGYSRGTFYIYYDDVYDIFNKIRDRFLMFLEKFTISIINITFKNQQPTEDDYIVFDLVKKHRHDLYFLLIENGNVKFQKKYFEILSTHLSKQISTSDISQNLIYFYVSGQMGFIVFYLTNNSSCTLDELIRDLKRVINYQI